MTSNGGFDPGYQAGMEDLDLDIMLSNTDKMRFTSLTYEIIEELRMRRRVDLENQRKIEVLLQERFSLGRQLDEEKRKVSNMCETFEANLRENRQQLDSKLRDSKLQATQNETHRKLVEEEKDSLKEEIRKLQLNNYTLERKLQESEHQEKIRVSERQQHIQQMALCEKQFKEIQGLATTLNNKQKLLEEQLKLVQDVNTKLQYSTTHQTCILKLKDMELGRLRQQIVHERLDDKMEPQQFQEMEEQLGGEIARLKESLKVEKDMTVRLTKQKDDWMNKYWDSIKQLDDVHQLANTRLFSRMSMDVDQIGRQVSGQQATEVGIPLAEEIEASQRINAAQQGAQRAQGDQGLERAPEVFQEQFQREQGDHGLIGAPEGFHEQVQRGQRDQVQRAPEGFQQQVQREQGAQGLVGAPEGFREQIQPRARQGFMSSPRRRSPRTRASVAHVAYAAPETDHYKSVPNSIQNREPDGQDIVYIAVEGNLLSDRERPSNQEGMPSNQEVAGVMVARREGESGYAPPNSRAEYNQGAAMNQRVVYLVSSPGANKNRNRQANRQANEPNTSNYQNSRENSNTMYQQDNSHGINAAFLQSSNDWYQAEVDMLVPRDQTNTLHQANNMDRSNTAFCEQESQRNDRDYPDGARVMEAVSRDSNRVSSPKVPDGAARGYRERSTVVGDSRSSNDVCRSPVRVDGGYRDRSPVVVGVSRSTNMCSSPVRSEASETRYRDRPPGVVGNSMSTNMCSSPVRSEVSETRYRDRSPVVVGVSRSSDMCRSPLIAAACDAKGYRDRSPVVLGISRSSENSPKVQGYRRDNRACIRLKDNESINMTEGNIAYQDDDSLNGQLEMSIEPLEGDITYLVAGGGSLHSNLETSAHSDNIRSYHGNMGGQAMVGEGSEFDERSALMGNTQSPLRRQEYGNLKTRVAQVSSSDVTWQQGSRQEDVTLATPVTPSRRSVSFDGLVKCKLFN